MKALGHQESWSPSPQVHPPFQEARSHPNVSTRVSLTDLPTSSRCHWANLEADVRQGWGFKGTPSPHWLPGQQTRKTVSCSLLPLVLCSVSGTFNCCCCPPSGGVTRQAPFSKSHRCALLPKSGDVFSVGEVLGRVGSRPEVWAWCRKVGTGEGACQVSDSGPFSTPGQEDTKGPWDGAFASLKSLPRTCIENLPVFL